MATYKTPGVYVEEIDAFPPSVVGLSTSIPVFVGMTEDVPKDDAGDPLYNTPIAVATLVEYVEKFGTARPQPFTATIEKTPGDCTGTDCTPVFRMLELKGEPDINLYYQMQMYFNNGGGFCYVVALQSYKLTEEEKADIVEALATREEISIINLSDVALNDSSNYPGWCNKALEQCAELNRFLIADTTYADVGSFRAGIGGDYLKYGAAYTPYLDTSLSYVYSDRKITLTGDDGIAALNANGCSGLEKDVSTLSDIKTCNTLIYNQVLAAAALYKIDNLPAGGAVAGIYCRVDTQRGVWIAPSNRSLNSVRNPCVEITPLEQADLNVDASAGKSINAIRKFPGKGDLVWGARTLDGNSNDWRYISVRRTVSYVERSLDVALQPFVFESNNAMTWLKIKTMIENFLNGLYLDGGLAGSSAADAYFVNIGLGVTMSAQDILEGRMKISIGLAVVRPAEFIILEVTQMMQKS